MLKHCSYEEKILNLEQKGEKGLIEITIGEK